MEPARKLARAICDAIDSTAYRPEMFSDNVATQADWAIRVLDRIKDTLGALEL